MKHLIISDARMIPTRTMAKTIYLSGLFLYIASLFLPAYAPFGAWNQTGWEALRFIWHIDFSAVRQMNDAVQILNFTLFMLSAANNVFVVISMGLFPVRHRFNHQRGFKALLIAAVLSLIYVTAMLLMMEEVVLKVGFYVWCIGIMIIYVAFHPRLSNN